MLSSEKQELFNRIHHKITALMCNIEKFSEENKELSIQEMMYMSDMLKDISEVEKNIAKAYKIYNNDHIDMIKRY